MQSESVMSSHVMCRVLDAYKWVPGRLNTLLVASYHTHICVKEVLSCQVSSQSIIHPCSKTPSLHRMKEAEQTQMEGYPSGWTVFSVILREDRLTMDKQ